MGQLLDDKNEARRARFGQHMSGNWRIEFQDAKSAVRKLLMSLGYISTLFQIALDYLDIEGILDCYEHNPVKYGQTILKRLKVFGDEYGTYSSTFGLYTLTWLEAQQYTTADIFEFGSKTPTQFRIFLDVRHGTIYTDIINL